MPRKQEHPARQPSYQTAKVIGGTLKSRLIDSGRAPIHHLHPQPKERAHSNPGAVGGAYQASHSTQEPLPMSWPLTGLYSNVGRSYKRSDKPAHLPTPAATGASGYCTSLQSLPASTHMPATLEQGEGPDQPAYVYPWLS